MTAHTDLADLADLAGLLGWRVTRRGLRTPYAPGPGDRLLAAVLAPHLDPTPGIPRLSTAYGTPTASGVEVDLRHWQGAVKAHAGAGDAGGGTP